MLVHLQNFGLHPFGEGHFARLLKSQPNFTLQKEHLLSAFLECITTHENGLEAYATY
jgi:hypothetical protein